MIKRRILSKHRYDDGGTTDKSSPSIGSYLNIGTTLLPGIVDLFTDNPEEKKIENIGDNYVKDTQDLANTQFAGSNATLLEQSKYLPVWQDVDIDNFGGETNEGGAFLSGALSGASSAAATANPWIIGGAALVNGITSFFNADEKNRRKRQQVDRVNRAGREAANRALNNFNTAVATTDQTNDRWRMQNMYNTNYEEGGVLETNGATWRTGAEFIDSGNTHENNPFGGVQFGIASDGLPNLVEEGEVVIDIPETEDNQHSYAEGGSPNTTKYVLSNRVGPKDDELDLLRLITKKPELYKGYSYADIYKDILKKNGIEELTNRQDIRDYLASLNKRIADAQEATKLREQQEELLANLRNASPEEQDYIMQQFGINPQQPMEGEYLQEGYAAKGGEIYIKPSKRGTFTAAAKKHGKSVQAFASQVLAHKENYSPAMVKKANFARNASKWKHADGGYLYQDGGYWNTQQDLDNYYQAQLLDFYKQSNPRATSVPASYYLRGADARRWINQLATGDEQQQALANALKSSWGNADTDWSNNATWEFKNKYNPSGTVVEVQPYLDYYKNNPRKVDALWGIQHSPRLELINTDSADSAEQSPEIVLPVGPQSIQRYWKYDWNTGERTPATVEDFENVPTGWYVDESLNEEGPEDATGNVYLDYYLSNKQPSNIDTDDTDDNTYTPQGVNTYDWVLPAVSGATLLSDLFGLTNTPDYSNADRMGRAIIPPRLIDYNPNGRYMQPRLVDTNYITSRLANQGLAGINAAKDLSGNNRATALAQIAGQNYLTQQAMGEAMAKGQEANNAALQQAIQINNAVDRANAEGALQADRANQSVIESYARRYADQKNLEAKMREDIDNQVAANRSANWNNFLENLAGYFENSRNRDLANAQYGVYGYGWQRRNGKWYVNYDPSLTPQERKEAEKKAKEEAKRKNRTISN